MDAPGIREELRDMARRLGTVGYYVHAAEFVLSLQRRGARTLWSARRTSATRQKALQLMATINIPMVMRDADALLGFAATDQRRFERPDGLRRLLYERPIRHQCGGSPSATRIRAAASIYGVALVTDKPDSPHLAMQRTDARLYFGCAENDTYAPQQMIDQLRAKLDAEGGNAEVEVYPGSSHGFAFPSRPAYDKPAAERHWERLFQLFGDALS